MLGLKAEVLKPILAIGIFLGYSTGIYFLGKYNAYKEISSGISSQVKKVERKAKEDVKVADESARKVHELDRKNEQTRRELDEAIKARGPECDLDDAELRALNSIIERT